MNSVAIAVTAAGGPIAAAKACDKTRQAVDKWVEKGVLPRTDYTGETDYATKLAEAAAARGFPFERQALLDRILTEDILKPAEPAEPDAAVA
ncbi:MAG TPA: hypothetical protein VFM32_03975 [Spongiibacteraceae bacterium]|nr:hypothetical protein [Spongiibacteraceae bacterium]